MKKIVKACFFLSASLLILGGFFYAQKKVHPFDQTPPFIALINTKICDTIEHSENVPGLNLHEFAQLKDEISTTWNSLVKQRVIEVTGKDEDVRPYFVALQSIIEHVLSCELQNEIQSLTGIIHTPMPATPLCTKGEISKNLVASPIEQDPKRVSTIKTRTTIIRDFLSQGGELHIAYPKGGLEKRSLEQQAIYKDELLKHPIHLCDNPLNCISIPDDLIGATYLFTDQTGEIFAFAIKMTQAKDPKENGSFALWFGSVKSLDISQRIHAILNFLAQNGLKIDFPKT